MPIGGLAFSGPLQELKFGCYLDYMAGTVFSENEGKRNDRLLAVTYIIVAYYVHSCRLSVPDLQTKSIRQIIRHKV